MSIDFSIAPVPTTADIKRQFGRKTRDRANGILKAGAILGVQWDGEEESYLAHVQGTASVPYVVSIDLDEGFFLSFCSCPVCIDCKHAAAVLLYLMAAKKQADASGSKSAKASGRKRSSQASTLSGLSDWAQRVTRLKQQPRFLPGTLEPAGLAAACMIYSVEAVARVGQPYGVELCVYDSKLQKNGALTIGRLHSIDSFSRYYGEGATQRDDQLIDLIRAMALHSAGPSGYEISPPYKITGPIGAVIMQKLADNGQTFLERDRKSAFAFGGSRDLFLDWLSDEQAGVLRLTAQIEQTTNWVPVMCEPPWYMDLDNLQLGPLDTELTAAALTLMLDAPAVPVELAQQVANELSLKAGEPWIPLPATPNVEVVEDKLEVVLQLSSLDNSPYIANWVAALLMRYGEHHFNVDLQRTDSHSKLTDASDREVVIKRDLDSEYKHYLEFRHLIPFFEPCHMRDPKRFELTDYQPVRRDDDGRYDAFQQLIAKQEALENAGFTVLLQPPVGMPAQRVQRLTASLDSTGANWFELGLSLEHNGQQYQLMPMLLNWLEHSGGQRPLRWQGEDGVWVEAPQELLTPVVETLHELFDEPQAGNTVLLSRARALALAHLRDELADSDVDTEWQDSEHLFEMADKLNAYQGDWSQAIDSGPAPAGLQGELREYQLQGMAWLNFLSNAGFNGVLADDMGLGKTVQCLAHLQSLHNQTARKRKKNRLVPFLIVAPTSLLGNWRREIEQFTPGLSVRIWHGSDRHDWPLEQETAHVIVTSYSLALRDHDLLCGHGFQYLVLDEAQAIKNPNAKITQALKEMPIRRRLCLTGTPIENHLGELWSLFDFLMPGLLGSQKKFTQHFRTPIEKHGDSQRQARLNNVVQAFMLRRRKEQVAKELPKKTEIIREVVLEAKQIQLYESIRLAMQSRIKSLLKDKGLARSHIEMLDALLKLRQACCHPQLVKLPSARQVKQSAKTETVMAMIEELIDEGRKILLFSQFTEMLALLEVELNKRKIGYVKLTGRTRKRDEVIDAFQHGDAPLFLISLKAGGTGLNLTAADTVIHYDPWWNPAVERQATDRAHRIGQDKPVFVYKLVAKGTVEEKIVAMQARKQALADATVEKGGDQSVSSLSAEDVLSLFDAT